MWYSSSRLAGVRSRYASVLLWVMLMVFGPGTLAASWQSTLEYSVWQRHAAEGRLLELDAVRQLLRRFDEREGVTVVVRHPGGDAGSAWAVSFRDRLVAYGIPLRYIELLPGSGALDILHVSLDMGGDT